MRSPSCEKVPMKPMVTGAPDRRAGGGSDRRKSRSSTALGTTAIRGLSARIRSRSGSVETMTPSASRASRRTIALRSAPSGGCSALHGCKSSRLSSSVKSRRARSRRTRAISSSIAATVADSGRHMRSTRTTSAPPS